MPLPRPIWGLLVLLFLALANALSTPIAMGATSTAGDVMLTIDREDIGLGGVTRPGSWTPVRLHLLNRTSHPMAVICRWELTDTDGDVVVSQRTATLTPGREQIVWIYACPAISNEPTANNWRFSIIDTASAQEAASLQVKPENLVPASTRIIASTTSLAMGLSPYRDNLAQSESTEVLRGIGDSQFPDRPYGLSSISSLIWTADGPEPGSLSPDVIQSIHEWVRTGGHLVIVLPAQGDMWSSTRFADMLPKVTLTSQPDEWLPDWMGESQSNRHLRVGTHTMEPMSGSGAGTGTGTGSKTGVATGVSVLLRDTFGRPLVVGAGFGLGRVTLIGIDLTDPRLSQKSLPGPLADSRQTLWSTVFSWRMPVYSREELADFREKGQLRDAASRVDISLDAPLLRSKIEMRETFGGALVLAIVAFGVYWLLAGPVSFGLLKWRKQLQFAWLAFMGIVIVFSVLAWSGAWFIRPSNNRLAHVTVLQMDLGSGAVCAQSAVSIFIKDQTRVQVAVDAEREKGNFCTLASPGLAEDAQTNHSLEPLRIQIDAASPHAAMIPFRATSKQFVVRYSDTIAPGSVPSTPGVWPLPLGKVKIFNRWPDGKITHQFPSSVKNIVFVYCPGTGDRPVTIWKSDVDEWKPGQALSVRPVGKRPAELIQSPSRSDYLERNLASEGYLGMLYANSLGLPINDPSAIQHVATNEFVQALTLLSFYDTLPPPDFHFKDGTAAFVNRSYTFRRAWGRAADLTRETGLAKLIVLGHIEDSDLPVPLTVNSARLPSSAGWTMVQLVIPIEE